MTGLFIAGNGLNSVTSTEDTDTYIDLTKLNVRKDIDYNDLPALENSAAFMFTLGGVNGESPVFLPLSEQLESLPNVWCLTRSTVFSGVDWVDEADWEWTNFTSLTSEVNLGNLNIGDHHRKNFTTELAREWQNRINNGENLPDLYICQMTDNSFSFGIDLNPNVHPSAISNIWNSSIKVHYWALRKLLSDKLSVVHLGLFNDHWENEAMMNSSTDAYLWRLQSFLIEHDKIAGFHLPHTYCVPGTDKWNWPFLGDEAIAKDLKSIEDRKVTALDITQSNSYDQSLTEDLNNYFGVYIGYMYFSSASIDELQQQFWDKGGYKGYLMTSVKPKEVEGYQGFEFSFENVDIITGELKNQEFEVVLSDDQIKRVVMVEPIESTYTLLVSTNLPPDTILGSVEIINIKQGSPINHHAIFVVNDSLSSFRQTGKAYITIGIAADSRVFRNLIGNIEHWEYTVNKARRGGTTEIDPLDPSYIPLGFGTTGGCAMNVDIKISLLFENDHYVGKVYWRENTVDESGAWIQISGELLDYVPVIIPAKVSGGGQMGLVFGLGSAGVGAADVQRLQSFADLRFLPA